ncbi:LacI family DNA-binding transcriptional regulator [Saxibacter everestensis]|uniref:LacI family DNA-binding transcriptional regulator n=1 Tax=Saxibacter everestensis TaxID=2909229 RepID=A0ABY8QUB1_9MICO|nr:LacI family DNA-binding transcriptional regulator [Brevibacteriaceae bacterium ZFBP1038]
MDVRLPDIAEEAGVSLATVSRVLGERGKVAPATREKVRGAIERLGYNRSTLLQRSTGRMVGLVVPAQPESWQSAAIHELSRRLEDNDLCVAVVLAGEGSRRLSHFDLLMNGSVAAIATPAVVDRPPELSRSVPFVRLGLTGESTPDDAGSGGVAARLDVAGALEMAVQHLESLGHRRIGMVCDTEGPVRAELRSALHRVHPTRLVDPDIDRWIVPAPRTVSGGQRATRQLLDATCTALICQSQLQTHGALSAIREHRMAVPRDVSLIDFSDSIGAQFANPPLSVLRLNADQIALAISELLIANLEPGQAAPIAATETPELPLELLVRGSTARTRL